MTPTIGYKDTALFRPRYHAPGHQYSTVQYSTIDNSVQYSTASKMDDNLQTVLMVAMVTLKFSLQAAPSSIKRDM